MKIVPDFVYVILIKRKIKKIQKITNLFSFIDGELFRNSHRNSLNITLKQHNKTFGEILRKKRNLFSELPKEENTDDTRRPA